MDSIEEFCPKDSAEWRKWLELNHNRKDSIWLIFYKKKSPNHNLSWSEAVDQALCYGWIDSVINTIDKETYKQYFTKRKPKSNWSKVNKTKVKDLIDQGLMKAAGYKSIEVAKKNGSWTILDDVEALIMPKDLEEALAHYQGAQFFDELSNSVKKLLLYWVKSAKREETRRKRILEIAQNAGKNLKPKQFR